MARKPSPKPWLHSASGYWCATLGGKRQYLAKDYHTACRRLRHLRAQACREENGQREWLNVPFSVLADEFLDDIKARRKLATYANCRYNLLRALRIIGTKLPVAQIRKIHLAKIEQELAGKVSPTTMKHTLTTVIGVFHWAVRNDPLEFNPVAGYRKPAARRRTRIVEPHEFQSLLRHADSAFRRVLIALKFTGCRPVEIRSLIWEWVDLANAAWVIPDHKTVTQQRHPRPRIIPLPTPIRKLCRRLAERPHAACDHVFLNRHGRPYTKDCLVKKMARVRQRAGMTRKAGEQLVLYSNRHSFATNHIGKVTDLELAELLGHTDSGMLARYAHVNLHRLHDIRRRASG